MPLLVGDQRCQYLQRVDPPAAQRLPGGDPPYDSRHDPRPRYEQANLAQVAQVAQERGDAQARQQCGPHFQRGQVLGRDYLARSLVAVDQPHHLAFALSPLELFETRDQPGQRFDRYILGPHGPALPTEMQR